MYHDSAALAVTIDKDSHLVSSDWSLTWPFLDAQYLIRLQRVEKAPDLIGIKTT